MKKNRFPFLILQLLFFCPVAHAKLNNGDIVFQTSRSSQSRAIQLATHSPYSHIGIVFYRKGKPYVYEAEGRVVWTPLQEWKRRAVNSIYVTRRMKDFPPDAVFKLRKATEEFLDKPYDPFFEWSDARIYCSELVWKVYKNALGVELGKLQKLQDFDLSNPIVQQKIGERFGSNPPLNEPVISPVNIFNSQMLEEVNND
jgi:hypothetical protein